MRIVVCGSIEFTQKIKEIADKLIEHGHEVEIPLTSQKIISGELTLEDFLREKEKNGDSVFRESMAQKVSDDLIRRYFHIIEKSDAILVLNYEKKGIAGYIGGNTFLEMGFAHVLNKKIFLLNPIPEMGYKDEIIAMQPEILHGDFSKINEQ
ncbi:MAG: hypothetical protein ABII19_03530 [Patescibacteria group bacterium]